MCPCADCGVETQGWEFYMVQESLWNRAAPEDPHRMDFYLCVGCLEARIGRRLRPEDFKDVPGHHVWEMSERLMNRLGVPGNP